MPDSRRELQRHDLVWLDAHGWQDALLAPLPAEWLAGLDGWFCKRQPAVVRRRESFAAEALSLGVAFPPGCGKAKIPLLVDHSAVIRASAPLLLADTITSAPAHWGPWLVRLVAEARALGVEFRVYGSLAWQHLSHETYITAASDVDLLWRARDEQMLRLGLDLLERWQGVSGLRADGELLLAGGAAVAWKELRTTASTVLIKHRHGVELQPAPRIHGLLDTAW